MNILARAMRALMRARGVDGAFCVGPSVTYYEWEEMRLMYNYRDFGVGGNIDAGGTSERATREKLLAFLHEGSTFYDIGAHEGLFTITVKKRVPGVTVHAFEPLSAGLEENLALNAVNDVVVHRAAVGDRAGSITMSTDQRSSNHVTAEDGGTIPMIALDDLDLAPPTIIKLDIEGFELHALKGARQIIIKYKPIIVTEINRCFLRYHSDLRPLHDFMGEAGYACYALQNNEFVPAGTPALVGELPPSADANYWWTPGARAESDHVGSYPAAAK